MQPICRARRAAFSSPPATPRCIPTGGAPRGQLRRRLVGAREARRATVGFMDGPKAGPGGTDLLTIGLLVFFVALLVLVAALLFLPSML